MAATQNPSTGPDIDALKKEIERLDKLLKAAGAGLGFDLQKALAAANNDADKLNSVFKLLNREYKDLTGQIDYTYQAFREITAELQNQNVLLKAGKSSFRELTSVAQQLNNYTDGTADLNKKQLKSLETKIAVQVKDLTNTKDLLEINRKTRQEDILSLELKKQEKESLERKISMLEQQKISSAGLNLKEQLRLQSLKNQYSVAEGLNAQQKKKLEELKKEEALYTASVAALETGIPVLKNELDLSKQILQTRGDIGGLAVKTGKLLSSLKIGGLVGIDEATEAAEEFSKKQVQFALTNKKLQEDILKIEERKNNINLAADKARTAIFKSNASEKEKEAKLAKVDEIQKKGLNRLDEESVNIKKKAIAQTNNLANQFGALGKFAQVLGNNLLKAVTDPVTILTFFIKEGFKADRQMTELGKSLGISKSATYDMRQNMARFTRDTNDAFVTTERLMKAQGELSKELGIAVKFSNQELKDFSKLTELTGLTTAEAAKFNLISAGTNKTTAQYTDEIRKGAYFAQQATKTHFSSKEILQDVSKLSAGILVKFQGNPRAIAEAVVQAKSLGMTLEKIDAIGSHMLQWESSIENELKAELITGRQLNIERARAAALTGDQATLMKEVAKQTGSLKDFQKMNVIAQQTLAQAFGMQREDMADMLMKQELIAKYGNKAAELNAQQAKDLQKSGLSLEDYLKKQEQQQAAQDKINQTMQKFQEIIGNLLAGPVGKLLDMFGNALNIINSIASIVQRIGESFGGLTGTLIALIVPLSRAAMIAKSFAIFGFRGAVAAIFRSFSSIPFGLGIPLAIAAVAGLTRLFDTKKADDLASEGEGYGNRTLLINKGGLRPEAIKLNNNDNLYATTNRIQPVNRSSSTFDTAPITRSIERLASATMEMAKRPVTAQINGKRAFADDVGREASLGTSQTRNTYSYA